MYVVFQILFFLVKLYFRMERTTVNGVSLGNMITFMLGYNVTRMLATYHINAL